MQKQINNLKLLAVAVRNDLFFLEKEICRLKEFLSDLSRINEETDFNDLFINYERLDSENLAIALSNKGDSNLLSIESVLSDLSKYSNDSVIRTKLLRFLSMTVDKEIIDLNRRIKVLEMFLYKLKYCKEDSDFEYIYNIYSSTDERLVEALDSKNFRDMGDIIKYLKKK